ncbi:MAG: metallophosphoesterase [Chloroflexota bacterium]
MGRYDASGIALDLDTQYNRPRPLFAAEELYEQNAALINPQDDPAIRAQFIEDNAFNTVTYNEIFTLPDDSPGGETYYSITFGDVALVSMYATRIWRTGSTSPNALGKYVEPRFTLTNPFNCGHGEFIFEPVQEGSEQYTWLAETLNSEAFQSAPYKVVLMHHPMHSLGGNVIPAFTDPVPTIERNPNGEITAIRYEYPLSEDKLINDIQPLLIDAGVDLVLMGHSHVYNRFADESGIHFLESSNVGNSYDAFVEGGMERRNGPRDRALYNEANYPLTGNPFGLDPIMPTIAPLTDEGGNPQPFVASDQITVFSILTTEDGVIRSYYFDTTQPDNEVVLFDEFALNE